MLDLLQKVFRTGNTQAGLSTLDIERDLAKRHLDELSKQLTTAWTIYIQFYTVFLTANVLGLALVVEKMDKEQRWPVIAAFVFQNIISFVTALHMSWFSEKTELHFQELSLQIAAGENIPALKKSPIPGSLGKWAGRANAATHVGFGLAWFAVFVTGVSPAKDGPVTNVTTQMSVDALASTNTIVKPLVPRSAP